MTVVDRESLIGLPIAENHVHLEGCLDALSFVAGVAIDGNESAEGTGCERVAPAIERARAADTKIQMHADLAAYLS